MTDTRITLEDYEVHLAAGAGLRRHIASLFAGQQHRNEMPLEMGWTNDIEGACGEYAASKFFDKCWDGSVNTFRTKPDLGNLEIKTRSEHWHDLIIRDCDLPDRRYILVTGKSPNFWIRGWLYGRDARKDEWWKTHGNRPGAWFVPVTELNTSWPAGIPNAAP